MGTKNYAVWAIVCEKPSFEVVGYDPPKGHICRGSKPINECLLLDKDCMRLLWVIELCTVEHGNLVEIVCKSFHKFIRSIVRGESEWEELLTRPSIFKKAEKYKTIWLVTTTERPWRYTAVEVYMLFPSYRRIFFSTFKPSERNIFEQVVKTLSYGEPLLFVEYQLEEIKTTIRHAYFGSNSPAPMAVLRAFLTSRRKRIALKSP